MDSAVQPDGVKLRKGRVDPVAHVQQVGVRVDGGVEAADEHVAVVLAAGEQAQSAAVHEQLRPRNVSCSPSCLPSAQQSAGERLRVLGRLRRAEGRHALLVADGLQPPVFQLRVRAQPQDAHLEGFDRVVALVTTRREDRHLFARPQRARRTAVVLVEPVVTVEQVFHGRGAVPAVDGRRQHDQLRPDDVLHEAVVPCRRGLPISITAFTSRRIYIMIEA